MLSREDFNIVVQQQERNSRYWPEQGSLRKSVSSGEWYVWNCNAIDRECEWIVECEWWGAWTMRECRCWRYVNECESDKQLRVDNEVVCIVVTGDNERVWIMMTVSLHFERKATNSSSFRRNLVNRNWGTSSSTGKGPLKNSGEPMYIWGSSSVNYREHIGGRNSVKAGRRKETQWILVQIQYPQRLRLGWPTILICPLRAADGPVISLTRRGTQTPGLPIAHNDNPSPSLQVDEGCRVVHKKV